MIAHIEAILTLFLIAYLFNKLSLVSRAKNIITLSQETKNALLDQSKSDYEKERITQKIAIEMLKLFFTINFLSCLCMGVPFLILYLIVPITGYSIEVIYSLLSSPIYIASFVFISLFIHVYDSKK
ncbi:hypothetical protein [Colwellia sp. E2M01]|uniref:hypothetical protein n=1 Tax=Colwellia sp. E2M01 TaxID=2841561 RepID=UPI001C095005|nr:hypothetical protein [Colwellia sp. E2M01]MBU2870951.1 hypothetical protein [Colwellia sp. E2M01]